MARRSPDLRGEGEEEGGGGEEGVVVWEGASRWRRGASEQPEEEEGDYNLFIHAASVGAVGD